MLLLPLIHPLIQKSQFTSSIVRDLGIGVCGELVHNLSHIRVKSEERETQVGACGDTGKSGGMAGPPDHRIAQTMSILGADAHRVESNPLGGHACGGGCECEGLDFCGRHARICPRRPREHEGRVHCGDHFRDFLRCPCSPGGQFVLKARHAPVVVAGPRWAGCVPARGGDGRPIHSGRGRRTQPAIHDRSADNNQQRRGGGLREPRKPGPGHVEGSPCHGRSLM